MLWNFLRLIYFGDMGLPGVFILEAPMKNFKD